MFGNPTYGPARSLGTLEGLTDAVRLVGDLYDLAGELADVLARADRALPADAAGCLRHDIGTMLRASDVVRDRALPIVRRLEASRG